MARRRAPPHPAPQLMQLRQPEPFATSIPTSMTLVATRTCTALSRKLRIVASRSSAFIRPCTSPTRSSANVAASVSAIVVAAFRSARSDSSMTG